jgi:GLPGLI family protein|tara:strand:- start:49 stop:882 length:834 start_codon:yes stop_codon:yes gene_type:complete
MKKSIHLIFILLFLATANIGAQEFQGSAFYLAKTNINTDFTKNIPIERRQYVIDRIKSNSEKNYQLDFNNTGSLFYEEQRLDVSGSSGRRSSWMSSMNPIQGTLYRDYSSKMFVNRVELFGKFFLIKDTLPISKWVMTAESKQIGAYTCYKAILTREVPQRVFGFGRQSEDSDENKSKMKKINIEAWFTPQIPVATGPAKHNGLPGLILEVSSENTTILCTKIVMNPKEKLKIKVPKKGTEVNLQEYEDIRVTKSNEMREMFRRRGSRGGGRPGGRN